MALNELIHNGKTRSWIVWGLVFCFCLAGCKDDKAANVQASVVWENSRPVALAIPRSWLKDIPADSFSSAVQVRLQHLAIPVPVFGEYTMTDTSLVFHPVIPFTRGLKYTVWVGDNQVSEIQIPVIPADQAPQLTMIHPRVDTVPANLLKIHLEFSKPMQEGELFEKILLLKNGKDTVRNAFLDLRQELWSRDFNRVTVWFDPGRIKRDLQPNITMGLPLEEGVRYLLVVDKSWRDEDGAALSSDYQKWFVTGPRDTISPDISKWIIKAPSAGSEQPVVVGAGETLDYVLLSTAVQIADNNGATVPGRITPDRDQKGFSFIPLGKWKAGEYTLRVESRLEDLAGNNLNRLFDNDLSVDRNAGHKDFYTRSFLVK